MGALEGIDQMLLDLKVAGGVVRRDAVVDPTALPQRTAQRGHPKPLILL